MFKSKKKPSVTKPKQEEISWILEGVVEYLKSPSWTSPVMNFVDENCFCFENKEENKLEYTTIHNNYKSLVEKLLFEYIRELNINEDTFAAACNQSSGKFGKIEGMFEYIWAADDFLLFKRLMSQHNLLLEMQTISVMQEKELEAMGSRGEHSKSPPPRYELDIEVENLVDQSKKEFESRLSEIEWREQQDLRLAIEFSRREMELLDAQAAKEQRMLEEAIRLSLESQNHSVARSVAEQQGEVSTATASIPDVAKVSPTTPFFPIRENIVETNVQEVVSQQPPLQTLVVSSQPASESKKEKPQKVTKTLPPLKSQSASDAASDWIAQSQKEVASSSNHFPTSNSNHDLLQTKPGIDPSDLEKRREYLKSQREKILALKRKEREEELELFQESPQESNGDVEINEDKEKMLSARLALAERLKREVIQKKS